MAGHCFRLLGIFKKSVDMIRLPTDPSFGHSVKPTTSRHFRKRAILILLQQLTRIEIHFKPPRAINRSKQKSLFRRSPNRLTTPTHHKPNYHPAAWIPFFHNRKPTLAICRPSNAYNLLNWANHTPILANYLPYKDKSTGQQKHKPLHVPGIPRRRTSP